MAKNYERPGKTWTHTAAGTIASGGVVVMGDKVGVALADASSGQQVEVAVDGVFRLAKLSTDVVAQGAILYWDAGNSRLTVTASTHKKAGLAAEAAGNGATTVAVDLGQTR